MEPLWFGDRLWARQLSQDRPSALFSVSCEPLVWRLCCGRPMGPVGPLRRPGEILCVLQNAACALPLGSLPPAQGLWGRMWKVNRQPFCSLPQTGPERPELQLFISGSPEVPCSPEAASLSLCRSVTQVLPLCGPGSDAHV